MHSFCATQCAVRHGLSHACCHAMPLRLLACCLLSLYLVTCMVGLALVACMIGCLTCTLPSNRNVMPLVPAYVAKIVAYCKWPFRSHWRFVGRACDVILRKWGHGFEVASLKRASHDLVRDCQQWNISVMACSVVSAAV